IFPSAVAGPVAMNAEQWSAFLIGAGAGFGNFCPSSPVGVAARAEARGSVFIHAFIAPMSPRAVGPASEFPPPAARPPPATLPPLGPPGGELAGEQGVGEGPGVGPRLVRGLVPVLGGEGLDLLGDLGGHQPAVLVAAFVWFALDVQDNPPGLGVAVARTVAL